MRTTHHVRDSFAQNADHLAHDTPLLAYFAEVVCTLGATPPRTSTSPPRTSTSPPPNGGNCTIRGATRRRHAEARLLMVQNPHSQRCDALRKGQRARASPGATCFPTTPPPNGGNCSIRGATRRRHAVARLLMVQNPHHYPWCHAPSLASRSLTGAALPGGAPINAGKASPTGRILSEALRRGLPSAGILPRRCLGSSRDQRVCRFIPTCRGWRTDALLCGLVGIPHNCAS